MIACANKNSKIVKLLVENYPSIVNQKDKDGVTGFMFACSNNNNLETIKLLLNKYPEIIN